jgi:hypothetical protein
MTEIIGRKGRLLSEKIHRKYATFSFAALLTELGGTCLATHNTVFHPKMAKPKSCKLFSIMGAHADHLAKKSLPLSSTTTNAGKFSTLIFHTASMPSSGYSSTSTDLIEFCARMAAGPPMEPR